jgi:translation initiation factor 1A
MPNNRGGKKFKRGKKFSKFATKQTREIIYKTEGQEYARLERNLGDHRFEILCADGVLRIAHIPGSFRKRLWFHVGDYALVSMRSFQENKCDLCYKYNLT